MPPPAMPGQGLPLALDADLSLDVPRAVRVVRMSGQGDQTMTIPSDSNRLGYGLLAPFRFTSAQDFAAGGGTELGKSDLLELVDVEQGEVWWRAKQGTRLNRLRHRSNSRAIGALARVSIEQAVAAFDRRIRITGVTAAGGSDNKTELHIAYTTAGKPDKVKTTF
jgi:phage baseplate assembly protein W